MKKTFTLLSFLLLIFTGAQAKKYTNGYIIKSGSDTMYCQIKLTCKFGNCYDMYRTIDITDNDGNKLTYQAKDRNIKGFGFLCGGKSHDYILLKEGKDIFFAHKEETGKRLNLYSYCTFNASGIGAPYRVKVWIIESRTLDAVTINTGLFASNKQNLRDFLYNDSDLLPLFDVMVRRFSDIRSFVIEANSRADFRDDVAVSK